MTRHAAAPGWEAWLAALACLILSAPACAARHDTPTLPRLDEHGRAGYAQFLQAPDYRAFAIAPGGAWAWRGDMASAELARQAALADCRADAGQACLPYAQDGQVVFDPQSWRAAWRPYATAAQAARATVGIKRGQRFPDLAYRDAAGKLRKLSDQRGRVLLVHFWGSWCPPCQREMPDLEKLYRQLQGAPDIGFVFLPVREPAARARAWARQQRIALPMAAGLNEADHQAGGDARFTLADGSRIGDREIARVFPTSYVLDRHGLVLFAHTGPVSDWLALAPLLRDAAAGSER